MNKKMWGGSIPVTVSLMACRSCRHSRPDSSFESAVIRRPGYVEIKGKAVIPSSPSLPREVSDEAILVLKTAINAWPDSDPDKIFLSIQSVKVDYLAKSGVPVCEECLAKIKLFLLMGEARGYLGSLR